MRYSLIGPSIPPERLLKASLLMALYTVHSERLFCEQLDYNLLFRWFLEMDVATPSLDHSSFSRNRARLLAHHLSGRAEAQPAAAAFGPKRENRLRKPADQGGSHLLTGPLGARGEVAAGESLSEANALPDQRRERLCVICKRFRKNHVILL
jgi:hypothetical protein